jgi:hypothetical protein
LRPAHSPSLPRVLRVRLSGRSVWSAHARYFIRSMRLNCRTVEAALRFLTACA